MQNRNIIFNRTTMKRLTITWSMRVNGTPPSPDPAPHKTMKQHYEGVFGFNSPFMFELFYKKVLRLSEYEVWIQSRYSPLCISLLCCLSAAQSCSYFYALYFYVGQEQGGANNQKKTIEILCPQLTKRRRRKLHCHRQDWRKESSWSRKTAPDVPRSSSCRIDECPMGSCCAIRRAALCGKPWSPTSWMDEAIEWMISGFDWQNGEHCSLADVLQKLFLPHPDTNVDRIILNVRAPIGSIWGRPFELSFEKEVNKLPRELPLFMDFYDSWCFVAVVPWPTRFCWIFCWCALDSRTSFAWNHLSFSSAVPVQFLVFFQIAEIRFANNVEISSCSALTNAREVSTKYFC